MSQCLHITLSVEAAKLLPINIQKKARELGLEGIVQATQPTTLMIIVCGTKDRLDDLVDMLHQEAAKKSVKNIAIEPFVKTKDYRGVFRIIE